jgi:nucleoside-diphosphate-sugar epimerase
MATALVLGGSGQVGQAVVPALLGDGWDVRVLCRGTGDHIAHVRAWGAQPVAGDRRDDGVLDRAIGSGVDVLVDAIGYDDRDAAALLAHRDRIGAVVVISSAAVYADPAGRSFETDEFPVLPVPVPESGRTVAPGRDSYAAGKVALERAWLADDTVPTTVLRPGAIHGPGCIQPREWLFVKRALDGRDVRVLAYGGESRFHTTSTVVLAELVRLAAAAPGSRVLNAADPVALTVAEIGAAVHAVMGHDARTVTLTGGPHGDVGRTPWSVPSPVVLDLSAAERELGYVAPGGYEQTMPAAVEWLVDRAARGPWREAFGGFARMEAGHDLFDYAAEDAYLARAEQATRDGRG